MRGVGLSYGRKRGLFGERFWALENASLDVYRGETLGVVGRNASGKSTLLRVLAGIVRPDRGSFVNHGHRVALLALGVGFVPSLTGRQNAIFSGMLQGVPRRAITGKVDAIAEFAELGSFIDMPVATYSSGMHARLGFAVALQVDPDVLLIDESIGVGDEAFKEKSTDAMKARVRSDKTVVLVSHSGKLVKDLCDRAVWLEAGETRDEGDVDSVNAAYYGFLHARKASGAAPPVR